MSLTLHLTRAELWRLRWWFPAWCLIQALGLIAIIPSATDNGLFYSLAVTQPLLIALWSFFLALDVWLWASPQGAERFWPTRPISLGQLLGSRLLVLALLVVLAPLAASLPFWLCWHLDSVQYWRAIYATLMATLGGLAGGLLVCLVNPYMGQRSNRLLQALLTVFLLGVPVELLMVWVSKQDLIHVLPLPVRQGVPLVAVCALVPALGLFFRSRSRLLALSVLVLLPCLSVPLLYLVPARKASFPDSPKAQAVLGGLSSLRLGKSNLRLQAVQFLAERTEVSAGPVEISLEGAVLLQEGNRVPVRGNWHTVPTDRGPGNFDDPVYTPGERRVQGTLYYSDEVRRSYESTAESPVGLLSPDKPVTFKGRLIVSQRELVKGRELLVDASGAQSGGEGMHVRRVSKKGPDLIEVYTDFSPRKFVLDEHSRFKVVDVAGGERIRDRRTTSYRDIPVLGVTWRSESTSFSPPLPGAPSTAKGYRVIEYTQRSSTLGFVSIEAPIAVDFSEAMSAPTTVLEVKK